MSVTIPTSDELMARARERTGLSDFGPPSFREGLDVFLRSMREDGDLTAEGAEQLVAALTRRLCSRLGVEDWYAKHPEVEQQVIEKPLLITGLPRTGTSAFAANLSVEPAFRCLRAWEQEPPTPPPILEEEAGDPRRLAMQARLKEMEANQPEQMAMHLHELDSTTEDVSTLALDFRAQTCTAPVFGYHAWWRDCDMRPTYLYQRRVMKLLQSRRPPNRWLFKAPHYAFHLEAVCAAYPDGRFVVTHRDPVKTIPSWASLITSLYPPGSVERIGMARIGPHLARHQAIGMRRMIEARERIGQDRFLDIHHHEFVADPMGVIERVYAFIGLTLSAQTRAGMLAWSSENRPGAHGAHRYTAEQFGLSPKALREQFGFYTDAYGVRLESV